MVLVTPYVVAGLNPGQVPPLPGERWRHPSEGELFTNGDIGGPMPAPAATGPAPEFYGKRGFSPATQPTTAPRK